MARTKLTNEEKIVFARQQIAAIKAQKLRKLNSKYQEKTLEKDSVRDQVKEILKNKLK
mgnify:CR=1 FL=1|tara:strand:+ start:155 stop:328 length:174 start_codon:yes stop_codon:yes gene_type:complete